MPSGDQSVNIATPGASGHSGLQQAHLSAFALKRSGPERLATSKEVFKAARSSIFCRSSASGHRASHSKYTRGQSRETGSLSRLSGSVEASAKCVSLGPAHCRKRLHDSVRVSSASIQQGVSHSGGPQEGRPSRWKKSVLSPVHVRILQYMWPHLTSVGVVWDSTTVQACLSPAQIESILMAVQRVREGQSLTVKQYRKLLGLMAAASNVIPFGLLYMRPLQWWLRTKGFSPRENPFRMIKVTCGGTLVPVTRPSAGGFLVVAYANDGCLPHGLGSGSWVAAPPRVYGEVTISCGTWISWRCWPCCRLWNTFSQTWEAIMCWFTSRQQSSGLLYQQAGILSRQGLRPGEWKLHTKVVEQIWKKFGWAQVDLFASYNVPCGSSSHGTDLAEASYVRLHPPPPPPKRVRQDVVHLLLVAPVLARPAMVCGPGSPTHRHSMGDSPPISSLRRAYHLFTPFLVSHWGWNPLVHVSFILCGQEKYRSRLSSASVLSVLAMISH